MARARLESHRIGLRGSLSEPTPGLLGSRVPYLFPLPGALSSATSHPSPGLSQGRACPRVWAPPPAAANGQLPP